MPFSDFPLQIGSMYFNKADMLSPIKDEDKRNLGDIKNHSRATLEVNYGF